MATHNISSEFVTSGVESEILQSDNYFSFENLFLTVLDPFGILVNASASHSSIFSFLTRVGLSIALYSGCFYAARRYLSSSNKSSGGAKKRNSGTSIFSTSVFVKYSGVPFEMMREFLTKRRTFSSLSSLFKNGPGNYDAKRDLKVFPSKTYNTLKDYLSYRENPAYDVNQYNGYQEKFGNKLLIGSSDYIRGIVFPESKKQSSSKKETSGSGSSSASSFSSEKGAGTSTSKETKFSSLLHRIPNPPTLLSNPHIQFAPWLIQNELHRALHPIENYQRWEHPTADGKDTIYLDVVPPFEGENMLSPFEPKDRRQMGMNAINKSIAMNSARIERRRKGVNSGGDSSNCDKTDVNTKATLKRKNNNNHLPLVLIEPGLRSCAQDVPGTTLVRRLLAMRYGEDSGSGTKEGDSNAEEEDSDCPQVRVVIVHRRGMARHPITGQHIPLKYGKWFIGGP